MAKASSNSSLHRALNEADLRVLLMVLFQLTGDRSWISPPYQPRRDVNLIADETAGLDEEVQSEIRYAMAGYLLGSFPEPALPRPDDELVAEMMSVCLGEAVPPEYGPMMSEEMGFRSRQVEWNSPQEQRQSSAYPVVIVGAGASGIALGVQLLGLRIPFVILEANDEVGGTWYANRYPGCGVDTPSHAYSFSFGEPYPWSRYFAPREEIQDYLERSATTLELRRHIRFKTEVMSAKWDEESARWRVRVNGPEGMSEVEGFALVSAIGQLSTPSVPPIQGLESYGGPIFHSSAWPDELDIQGKRLAVVGTGASSMQIVPSVVDSVAKLDVYQRSAQWARPIPRYHEPISSGVQWLLREVPLYRSWFRCTMLWRYGDGLLSTLRKDPSWPHQERSVNKRNDRHREQMEANIRAELSGRPDLVSKCIPSYPPYGKRILLDNGWYAAIRRQNAELVVDSIERLTAGGIVTTDGKERPADVIVLATGFNVTTMAARLDIEGRNGIRLAEAWRNDNPTAYLGITVPGFPNFFCMQGPNTGLGHGGSAIFQAECQARYIADSLVQMIETGHRAIEVRPDRHDEYVDRVDREHEQMIWTHPGMSTYYRNVHGRVVSVMPWRLVDYRQMTRAANLDDYRATR